MNVPHTTSYTWIDTGMTACADMPANWIEFWRAKARVMGCTDREAYEASKRAGLEIPLECQPKETGHGPS